MTQNVKLTQVGKAVSWMFVFAPLTAVFVGYLVKTDATTEYGSIQLSKIWFIWIVFFWKLLQLLINFARARKQAGTPALKDVYIYTMNQPFFSLK